MLSTMKRFKILGLVCVWLGLSLVSIGQPLSAQVVGNGVIQGTITDPSGAIVPGASVTATGVATGVKITREATGEGFYVLTPVPEGVYTVSASAKGFKTTVQEHVTVNALAYDPTVTLYTRSPEKVKLGSNILNATLDCIHLRANNLVPWNLSIVRIALRIPIPAIWNPDLV